MDVRKFEAYSMQDAIKLVKKEMGRDAVILSTREKNVDSKSSGGQNKIIEVVAARSATSSPTQSPPQSHSRVLSASAASEARAPQFPRITTREPSTIVRGSPVLSQLNQKTKIAAQTLAAAMENQPPKRIETQSNNEHLSPHLINATNEIQELRRELLRVKQEIESIPQMNMGEQVQELKVLLHDIMREQQKKDQPKFHEYLADVGIKLRAAGVLDSLIGELLQTLSGLALPKDPDGTAISGDKLREFYFNSGIRLILKQLHVTGPWKLSPGQQQIVCVVGPTGVGKTTTIAKLAAKFKLNEGKKVAMVSMDTFRIAASDQLRIFAKILDCPFTEAEDCTQLLEFIEKYSDYDYIFIDTAGRSFRYFSQMEELRKMQGIEVAIHFHLVLASSMKQRDLDENIKAFRFLSPESFIFTKLDESWNFGEIFNSTIRSRIPISYFSVGQRVPEDIEVASKERVVERLFRL